jgi:hypothetical protein
MLARRVKIDGSERVGSCKTSNPNVSVRTYRIRMQDSTFEVFNPLHTRPHTSLAPWLVIGQSSRTFPSRRCLGSSAMSRHRGNHRTTFRPDPTTLIGTDDISKISESIHSHGATKDQTLRRHCLALRLHRILPAQGNNSTSSQQRATDSATRTLQRSNHAR